METVVVQVRGIVEMVVVEDKIVVDRIGVDKMVVNKHIVENCRMVDYWDCWLSNFVDKVD